MAQHGGPVRVAILGAGIFATDAYCPVLRTIPSTLLPRFLWSRTQEAAEKLLSVVREWAEDAEAVWGEEGLRLVEKSTLVPCCTVLLPIQHQPAMVKRMLLAGKHVLQEKPLAVSEEEAGEMLRWYTDLPPTNGTAPKPFWGVAENFRLEPAFAKAAEMVKGQGRVRSVSVCIEVAMAPSNKYYTSHWRRDPSLQGAFLADCGVHYVAGLREMLPGRVSWVSAHAAHMDPGLPPPDHLTASFVVDEEGGDAPGRALTGTLQISFCAPLNKMLWRAVCERGVVEVTRGTHEGTFGYLVTLTKPGVGPEIHFCEFGGIKAELEAFASEVRFRSSLSEVAGNFEENQIQRKMLSPLEAVEDLVVIAACLKSAKNNGASTKVCREGFECPLR